MKKIPSKLNIGGLLINVEIVHRCEGDVLGLCNSAEGQILIANTFDGKPQSETSKINTYWHEVVHCILDTMGEKELSENEKFVSCFGSFLTEAMANAYFKE